MRYFVDSKRNERKMKAGFLIKAMLLAAACGCVCGADAAGRETIDLSGEGWTFEEIGRAHV